MPRRATREPLLDLDQPLDSLNITNVEDVLEQILTESEITPETRQAVGRMFRQPGPPRVPSNQRLDPAPDVQVNRAVSRVRRVRRQDRSNVTGTPSNPEGLLRVLTEAGIIPERRPLLVVSPNTQIDPVTRVTRARGTVSISNTRQDSPVVDADDFYERVDFEEGRRVNARKLRGKIVICTRAMQGKCPVLVKRANTISALDLDDHCMHMVPHTHRGDECLDDYDRENSLPVSVKRSSACRVATCQPMEPVPEHRQNMKKPKPGQLVQHKRTLIID